MIFATPAYAELAARVSRLASVPQGEV